MRNNLNQFALPKPKRSRASKKSGGLRQRLLIASVFLTLGFKFIRLIEEVLKMFKP
jgi:ABC-type multidrug transport system ATPase subunit